MPCLESPPKTFHICTYGCQMNELDSAIVRGMLEKRGMTLAGEEEADLLLFNTCSIRDLAERKVMGKLGQIGRKGRPQLLGVMGCMANAKQSTLFQKLPHLDFVLGTNNIHELPDILDTLLSTKEPLLRAAPTFTEELDYQSAIHPDPYKAYVSIIRGCSKRCTYCVVPYTRGPEVSRPLASIVEECTQLVEKGYQEITLLGQNVNSYGKDWSDQTIHFPDLLAALDRIPGLHRLRFLTSHPVDITRALMEAIRDLPSVCHQLHFPLQAGANRILRKMHRMYTKEEYLEKVAQIKEIVPDIALGTDMIVGFPTESEEEFAESLEAMRQVRYAAAFLYTYSPRKGTPAQRWKDDVPSSVKKARHQQILSLYETLLTELLQAELGRSVELLVERRSKDGRYLRGTTRKGYGVLFAGPDSLIGTLQEVTLHSFSHHTFLARIADEPL